MTTPELPLLPLSYSKLSSYESCPLYTKFSYIEKREEPTNIYAQRGTNLHSEAELYITRSTDVLTKEMTYIKPVLDDLRNKKAQAEMKVGIRSDWSACDYKDPFVYVRGVVDAHVPPGGDVLELGDFKSGKVRDYHADQIELYAQMLVSLYPAVKTVTGWAWYIDGHRHTKFEYHVDALFENRPRWERRFTAALSDDIFPARPGPDCRWCAFRKGNGGPCAFG